MRVFIPLLALFVSLSLWATPGIILETKGSVVATLPGKKPVAAKLGLEFPDGTKLQTAQGATAKLMFMNGGMETIGERTVYVVGGKQNQRPKKSLGQGMLLAMKEAVDVSGSGPTVTGMVKMVPGVPLTGSFEVIPYVGGIEGIFPAGTSVTMEDLTSQGVVGFKWSGPTIQGEKPILALYEEGGSPLFFPIVSDLGSTEIPLKKLKKLNLSEGKTYRWYLGQLEKGKPVSQSQGFSFEIVRSSEVEKMNAELGQLTSLGLDSKEAGDWMQAQIFYKYKMYQRMVDTLSPIYEQYQTPAIQRLLFLGYVRMGKYSRAKEFLPQ